VRLFFNRDTALAALMMIACLFLSAQQSEEKKDLFSMMGFRETEGAVAGYVADKSCATCHLDLYTSYQHVGMAQSFAKPGEAKFIEDFGETYYHEPSKRYYRIDKEGDALTFHRYQKDAAGKPINEVEIEIDWIMGSGNRARSYLYRTEQGEMFMLPLGWYSEDARWGMSPGFEFEQHLGLNRQVRRECMFCHNALPEVPEGSDRHDEPHVFPEELPQGTGCQRCHGPGADHIRSAVSGASLEKTRAAIVNPKKLDPIQRDSVCFQCHMLPAVSIAGSRRFDRTDYSFRPGEDFSDYLVHVEVTDANTPKEDFFEINHHGYRFWQSACYQESDGALACISCHDPHVKPESTAFRKKVSEEVCLGCHAEQKTAHQPAIAEGEDCVGCHMPTRRTRDVVLVTMTDHRIARGPFDKEALVAPMEKKEPVLTDLDILPFGDPPEGDEAELYRIIAYLRTRSMANGTEALEKVLARTPQTSLTPYLDLLEAQLELRAYADAEQTARKVIARDPELVRGHLWLGVALLGQNKDREAKAALRKSLALEATPDGHYNYALAAYKTGAHYLALLHLDKAIALRPNLYRAWMYKGLAHTALDQLEEARDALVRSIEVEPANDRAYATLVEVLRKLGEHEAAKRYLEVGRRVSWNPETLAGL